MNIDTAFLQSAALARSGLSAMLVALTLSACSGGGDGGTPPVTGGGGGGDTPPPVVTPPPAVTPPTLNGNPQSATVTAAQPVTFEAYASADSPLAYQWQRNGIDIPGATQVRYTHIAQASEAGSEYRVRVSTAGGSVTSEAATLTVLPARAGTATLLAGAVGGPGNLDGTGAAARFIGPYGLAVDTAGNVLAAAGALRKVTPAGLVTTLYRGPNDLFGVVLDSAGNLFMGLSYGRYPGEGTLLKLDPNGTTTRVVSLDSPASSACPGCPVVPVAPAAIALDASGNFFVADVYNSSIRKVTSAGISTTFAGSESGYENANYGVGNVDGVGSAARFNFPRGLAVDAAGNVFVADTGNDSIRKITPAGVVSTLVSAGAGLKAPSAIAIDRASGDLFVADSGNQVIRRVTLSGAVTTLVGAIGSSGSTDGPAANARFAKLHALALDGKGALYIADNSMLRRLDLAGNNVTTIAGLGEPVAPVFGRYHATDAAGNIFIAQRTGTSADSGYALLEIGAGSGAARVLATGLSDPQGIGLDSAGNVYVADRKQICPQVFSCYYSGAVLRFAAADGRSTILAGSLTSDSSANVDGNGSAASLIDPHGLAVDAVGNVYLATNRPLRRITPAGDVSTVPIVPSGSSGRTIQDFAIDKKTDMLYAMECFYPAPSTNGPTSWVVRLDAQGNLTRLAGGYVINDTADGQGDKASFGSAGRYGPFQDFGSSTPLGFAGAPGCPSGIGVDAAGNVFVADTVNNTIRMVSPEGLVRTVAGRNSAQGISFGALPATLSAPTDVSFDGAGNMYVGSAHAIVKVRFDE